MPDDRTITYRAAVLEALFNEMRRDPNVILIGEDVGAAGGVFKQTEGLYMEFGAERVIDTPISEAGAFGMTVGAAMTGQRPVFEVMFGDFITAGHGPIGEPSCQGELHVRRTVFGPASVADGGWHWGQPRAAAFAKPACLDSAHPGVKGRPTRYAR
jgi:transketolase C-terminal domain/subunit